jgi:hypothetical protein
LGGSSCKPAKVKASAGRSNKRKNIRKAAKKQKCTLGNFQLARQGGALSLGLVIAGHEIVVQGSPLIIDYLKNEERSNQ